MPTRCPILINLPFWNSVKIFETISSLLKLNSKITFCLLFEASLRKVGCWWLTLLRSGPVVEIELQFETSLVGLNQDLEATDDRRLTVTVGNGGEAYGGPHYGWRRYNIFTFITSSWFLFRSNYILLELQSKFKGNTQVITIHISCYLNRNTNYNNISCYLNRNTNYNLCLK